MQKLAIKDHETDLVKRSKFDRYVKAFYLAPEEDRYLEAETWLNTGFLIIQGKA